MNISIKCKLSLSKKIRALIGKEAQITLVSQDIVNGVGTATLLIDSDSISDQIDMGETSLIITPMEMMYETPTEDSFAHSSLFSSIPKNDSTEKVVEKIAVVHPPEKGQESRAVNKEVKVPSQFKQLESQKCKTWIKNTEELIESLNKAKNKKSNIDLDSAKNERERLVLKELKDKEESIDESAWVVNDKVGKLTINDLNISLSLNSPYDLGSLSASKLLNSKDLRVLLREGFIRFISPEEKDKIIISSQDAEERNIGLSVFDDHEEAGDAAFSKDSETPASKNNRKTIIDERNSMEISEDNMDNATEEDMIINLTQSLPPTKNIIGTRKTVHGNNTRVPNANNENKTEKKAIRTIKKVD